MEISEKEIFDMEKRRVYCKNCDKVSRADWEEKKTQVTTKKTWEWYNWVICVLGLLCFLIPGLWYIYWWHKNKTTVTTRVDKTPVCHFCKLPDIVFDENHSNTVFIDEENK